MVAGRYRLGGNHQGLGEWQDEVGGMEAGARQGWVHGIPVQRVRAGMEIWAVGAVAVAGAAVAGTAVRLTAFWNLPCFMGRQL